MIQGSKLTCHNIHTTRLFSPVHSCEESLCVPTSNHMCIKSAKYKTSSINKLFLQNILKAQDLLSCKCSANQMIGSFHLFQSLQRTLVCDGFSKLSTLTLRSLPYVWAHRFFLHKCLISPIVNEWSV